ncbi:cysteine proteinase, partial [Suhomyces tanzawaensis NRRL Y-17324]
SADTSFNIKNEAVQPLGILLLRIMFDPNYSVIHMHNSLPGFKIHPRGLTNTGNICYMNSILQVLLYCQPFNKLLKLIEDKSIGSLSKVSKTPLLDATLQFFNEFVTKTGEEPAKTTSLSPENFYMNLISHEKFLHLKWGQQEDAEEFLGYYLDGLNDEFLQTIKGLTTPAVDSLIQAFSTENSGEVEKIERFKYDVKSTVKLIKNEPSASEEDSTSTPEDADEWNEVGSNNKKISVKRTVEIEPTPITMIFGGQFKSVLTIPKNPGATQFLKSITLDPYQHVQLDISEASSIDEALLHLNQWEKISYKTKENKEIQIKKQTFVDKLPSILIIHLKRFSFLKEKDVGIEKLRKKVEYLHLLHISKDIISSKNPRDENNQYRLIGVVYHHGSSAQGGHYTSDTKTGHQWMRIDDTQLKSVTEDEVLNGGVEENIKNAYILLYERLV